MCVFIVSNMDRVATEQHLKRQEKIQCCYRDFAVVLKQNNENN